MNNSILHRAQFKLLIPMYFTLWVPNFGERPPDQVMKNDFQFEHFNHFVGVVRHVSFYSPSSSIRRGVRSHVLSSLIGVPPLKNCMIAFENCSMLRCIPTGANAK